MANKKVPESSERPKVEEEEELLPEELGEDDEGLPEASVSPVIADRPVETPTPVFDTEQSCTTVGPTVVIRGKIRSDENLVVFGRIEAGIKSTKDVRLESTGVVNSDLHVRCVWVAGIVVGDIHATQLVELAPEARVVGDIYTARLIVKDGAKFRGRVEMDGLQALEALRPPAQAQATPKKTAKSSPAVAEVIWSDVEDLAPTPAHRQAAVTPQAEPVSDRGAAPKAPAPAQIAVTQRVRQPTAPAAPTKAPEKPAAPTPQPVQPAQSADKAGGAPGDGEKGIGSWFRRQ